MSSILLGRRAYGAPATTRVSRLPVLRLGLATTACTLKRLRSMFRRIASCGDCERESEIECTRLLSPVLPSAVRAMMMLIDPRINLLLQAPAAASSLRSLTSPRANINPLKTLLCQTTAKGAEAVVQSPTQLPASCSGGRSRSRASRKLKQKSSSSVSATAKTKKRTKFRISVRIYTFPHAHHLRSSLSLSLSCARFISLSLNESQSGVSIDSSIGHGPGPRLPGAPPRSHPCSRSAAARAQSSSRKTDPTKDFVTTGQNANSWAVLHNSKTKCKCLPPSDRHGHYTTLH